MRSIKTLSDLANSLGSPKDYFAGTPPLQDDMPVNILLFHRTSHPAKGGSKHHRFLLIINCQGNGEVILDGKRFLLEQNNGLLVMPFQHHHYTQYAEKISWFKITFEIADSGFLESKRNQIFQLNEEVIDLLVQLVKSYHPSQFKKPYFAKRISCYLSMVLNEIVHHCESALDKGSKDKSPSSILGNNELIDRIVFYIYKNLNSIKNIDEIALSFHISESHLRALFKKQTNISIWSYIQDLRIHKAQEFLGSSAMSLGEIANACGYSSIYVFSNAFKKKLKISPLNYRKSLKN